MRAHACFQTLCVLTLLMSQPSVIQAAEARQSGKQLPSKLRFLKSIWPLVQDGQGRVWGVLAVTDAALSEWNGIDWIKHPLPQGFQAEHLWYVAVDSRDRIWCLPTTRQNSVIIFDPAKNAWETFATYRAALEAQRGQHHNFYYRLRNEGIFLRPNEGIIPEIELAPRFSADGRICFEDFIGNIGYFDGRAWRQWSREEAKPGSVRDGPPFFNSAGNICVNIEHRTWQWTEAAGWHTTNYEPALDYATMRGQPKRIAVPPGCTVQNPTSINRDNQGAVWLTTNRQLYKALPNLCLPRFESAEHHPFMDERRVYEAFVDDHGNTFLATFRGGIADKWGTQGYVILPAVPPVPDTRVQFTKNAADSVTLDFATSVRGKRWFMWRLNGGTWSTPVGEPRVRLDFLPAGETHIEAVAVDSALQIDPTPAVAALVVNIDVAQQIVGAIAALADKDDARREAAVTALARQPAHALPALRAARLKANNDLRWWIDAAVQAAQENNRPTAQNEGAKQ